MFAKIENKIQKVTFIGGFGMGSTVVEVAGNRVCVSNSQIASTKEELEVAEVVSK
jgi:hypothetical protein